MDYDSEDLAKQADALVKANIPVFLNLIQSGTVESMQAFVSKLPPQALDLLMLQIGNDQENLFSIMVNAWSRITHPPLKQSLEKTHLLLLKTANNQVLNTLAQQTMMHINGLALPLLTGLFILEAPEKIIDAILSRLDDAILEDLVLRKLIKGMPFLQRISYVIENRASIEGNPSTNLLKPQKREMTSVHILKYISSPLLWEAVNQSINPEAVAPFQSPEQLEAIKVWEAKPVEIRRLHFFQRISSDKPVLFNAIMEKLLLAPENYVIGSLGAYVYRLNRLNLARYLAKTPQETAPILRTIKTPFKLSTVKHKPKFKKRLNEAAELCDQNISSSVAIYLHMEYALGISGGPANMILDYLIDDLAMRQRVEKETLRINGCIKSEKQLANPLNYLPNFSQKTLKHQRSASLEVLVAGFATLNIKSHPKKTVKH